MSAKVDICINGKPAKQYYHDSKTFVEGRKGSKFSIKIKNNEPNDVLAVISVDGINVISGDPAGKSQAGYIIAPNQTENINGFRSSKDHVAQFVFGDKKTAYASLVENGMDKNAAKDNPSLNCGCIGVRIYSKKNSYDWIQEILNKPYKKDKDIKPWPSEPYKPVPMPEYPTFPYPPVMPTWGDEDYWKHQPQTICSNDELNYSVGVSCLTSFGSNRTTNFDIGTNWGQEINDKCTESFFETDKIIEEIVIYYASKLALKEMGICTSKPQTRIFPEPFGDSKFCRRPS